jgi:thymidylate synthase (FAD)
MTENIFRSTLDQSDLRDDNFFVYEPIVHVISRPIFLEEHRVFLESQKQQWDREHGGKATDAELLIEFAGRTCYMSFSRPAPLTTQKYIENLVTKGHESVLEHASWTFVLSGVSRAFTHQLVRHRVGFAYSQLSQQYHDERGSRLIVPVELLSNPSLLEAWKKALLDSKETYDHLVKSLGVDDLKGGLDKTKSELRRALRSAARSVLPNAIETIISVTANARALRHFLKVRGSIEGDLEMRRVSAALMSSIKPEAPSAFFDFSVETAPDGYPIVRHRPSD